MHQTTNVERVTRVGLIQQMGRDAKNRVVVSPEDFDSQSPFFILVEDWLGPEAEFEQHPHRGIETVALVLDGWMEHADSTGMKGVVGPGDAHWMTAGSGIFHGGKAHGRGRVHALQLWLNLPAALKRSAPGTREQRQDEAVLQSFEGATVRTYGMSRGGDSPPCTVWPMTIADTQLEPHAEHVLRLKANERAFLYVLDGVIAMGDEGRVLSAGEVGWLSPASESHRGDRELRLVAQTAARVVVYASRPFSEPVAWQGPFVMNTREELRVAFAEVASRTFLKPDRHGA